MSFKRLYIYYMLFIGIFGQLVFYAQAYKIFTTYNASGVSLFGFSIGLLGVTSWFIYGIILKDFPLFLANLVAIVGAASVIVGILLYS